MDKSTRVILVEHGETRWSRLNVFISHTDLELSDLGRQQMTRVGSMLEKETFLSVYTSGMRRNTLSARLIAPGRRVREINDLSEIDYGDWEGFSPYQLRREQPSEWAVYEAGGPPPQGERYDVFFRRVASAVTSILFEQTENGTILMVCDPMVMKAVICSLLSLEPEAMWRFRTHPGAVATIEISDGFSILTRLI